MSDDLSVVVPVHDGATLLPRQLDAIAAGARTAGAMELVVVDNRSSDGSADVARAWGRSRGVPVLVVAAGERPGEPYARNVGLRAAGGELVAFCDADDEVAPSWVGAMGRALAASDYVTGPVDTSTLNASWQASSRAGMDTGRPPTTYGGVPFAQGCNMGFRRSVLLELGGFDETFHIGCDVEVGIRAWRHGIALTWEPDAVVHYRMRPSLREMASQARAYGRVQPRLRTLLADEVDEVTEARARRRRAAWMVRSVPLLLTRSGRARWLWVAGRALGEMEAGAGRGDRGR